MCSGDIIGQQYGDEMEMLVGIMPSKVTIAVAVHKPYWMPDDLMYVPVQAGALGREAIEGYCRDDEGDEGIAALNPHLCELTALYWAWKHLDADAVGLAHYRRHFAGNGDRGVLTSDEACDLLAKAPIVLPRERNYFIETVGNHYAHTFDVAHLELLKQVVGELSPESLPALESRLASTRAHMFNMFIMRRGMLDEYCKWLFPIVGMIEREFDYSGLSQFEARAPGRLAEFLIDTWIDVNNVPYVECRVKDMDPVNWVMKGSAFLAAKFAGRKYDRSF